MQPRNDEYSPEEPAANLEATPPVEPPPFQPEVEPQTPTTYQPQAEEQPYMPAAQPQPAYQEPEPDYTNTTYPPATTANGKKKRLFIIGGAVAALIVLLGSGFVFGYYLPNQPENVWRTSLGRTGEALDKYVVAATEHDALDAFANSHLTGSILADGPSGKFSGSINSIFSQTTSDTTLGFSQQPTGGEEEKIEAKILSNVASGETLPSIYFQVSGLKLLGIDAFVPGMEAYDGKWISITADYLKSLAATDDTEAEPVEEKITHQDAADLARAISTTTRDYVLSSDEEKSILVRKEFVGTEDLEGDITANHYKAGLSKAHAKNFCKAIIDAVTATNAYKKLTDQDEAKINESKQSAIEDCQKSADEDIDENELFDVWIDKDRKLVHKLRFTNPEDTKEYVEIGQTYTEGNILPLFVRYINETSKITGEMTMQVDVGKKITSGTLKIEASGSDVGLTINGSFEFKPYADGEVKFAVPPNSTPISELLEKIGLDPLMLSGLLGSQAVSTLPQVQDKANDTESQTDILALATQLEAYYADNGHYPALANLNNAAWRETNLSGLDEAALQTPSGTVKLLGPTASADQYGYTATDCAGNACKKFTLSARFETGEVYTKQSLN